MPKARNIDPDSIATTFWVVFVVAKLAACIRISCEVGEASLIQNAYVTGQENANAATDLSLVAPFKLHALPERAFAVKVATPKSVAKWRAFDVLSNALPSQA